MWIVIGEAGIGRAPPPAEAIRSGVRAIEVIEYRSLSRVHTLGSVQLDSDKMKPRPAEHSKSSYPASTYVDSANEALGLGTLVRVDRASTFCLNLNPPSRYPLLQP